MKQSLATILAKLRTQREAARKLADSGNESTADKYGPIWESLDTAVDHIEDALAALD